MKSNAVIACLAVVLVGLGVALAVMGISPAKTVAAHTDTSSYNWYFKPTEGGGQPVCADNAAFKDKYAVYYMGAADKKTIVLTFDAGYENGCTEKILDVLKEKDAPAAFFITGHFMESAPELIARMAAEGHIVGNHTLGHADLTAADISVIQKELGGIEDMYLEITGQSMKKFFRPPEGKYSEHLLSVAEELGYTTVFWSFAYKDWLVDDQPDHAAATEKVLSRTHSGAVMLLHSTSETNAAILGDLIDAWRADGYEIISLEEAVGEKRLSDADKFEM